MKVKGGKWYYEAKLLTYGKMHIGWYKFSLSFEFLFHFLFVLVISSPTLSSLLHLLFFKREKTSQPLLHQLCCLPPFTSRSTHTNFVMKVHRQVPDTSELIHWIGSRCRILGI